MVICLRASVSSFAWRALSSPHHACGLNGSFFLHTCGPFPAAQAVALLGVLGGLKPCGTLRRWVVFAKITSAHGQPDSVGASGKGLGFFGVGCVWLEAPYLLGLRPNFDGLGWVRLKVRIL